MPKKTPIKNAKGVLSGKSRRKQLDRIIDGATKPKRPGKATIKPKTGKPPKAKLMPKPATPPKRTKKSPAMVKHAKTAAANRRANTARETAEVKRMLKSKKKT